MKLTKKQWIIAGVSVATIATAIVFREPIIAKVKQIMGK